jgi:hypothetical protein
MRLSSTALVQCGLLLLGVGAVSVWLFTVPARLTPSSFVAFAALLGGCAWVTATSYINARPASSLAQSIHDADAADARRRRRLG